MKFSKILICIICFIDCTNKAYNDTFMLNKSIKRLCNEQIKNNLTEKNLKNIDAFIKNNLYKKKILIFTVSLNPYYIITME